MKKSLGFWLLAAFVLLFGACSNDDDESAADKIAGVYTGVFTVTLENGSALGDPMPNQKIDFIKVDDHTVNLELNDFKFGSIPVGDLKVNDVRVTDDGKVSGSATQVPIMNGVIKADLDVTGTVVNNQANLLIMVNAPLAAGETAIKMNVTFTGSK